MIWKLKKKIKLNVGGSINTPSRAYKKHKTLSTYTIKKAKFVCFQPEVVFRGFLLGVCRSWFCGSRFCLCLLRIFVIISLLV